MVWTLPALRAEELVSDDPVRAAISGAFQALLRGDTAERDRQVERARRIMDAQEQPPKIDLSREQIIERLLKIAEHIMQRPLSEAMAMTIRRNPQAFMQYLLDSDYRIPRDLMT
jgi:uncharacterized protein HemY